MQIAITRSRAGTPPRGALRTVRLLGLSFVAIALWAPTATAQLHTWTDRSGEHSAEAEFVDARSDRVLVRTEEGRMVEIRAAELSDTDRKFIADQLAERRRELKRYVLPGPGQVAYRPGRTIATLADRQVKESSGLCASRRHDGVFWTHNDSGSDSHIYAFDHTGGSLGACRLEGVRAFDWEDIASFRLDGCDYLLVADTGNNGLAAEVQMLHVIEEPAIDFNRGTVDSSVAVVRTILLAYEDDFRDCEAVAVDPQTKTVLLASKSRKPQCHVYGFAWPTESSDQILRVPLLAVLPLRGVTGMDISPDGRLAVLVTYNHAYEFARAPQQTWKEAFAARPAEILLPPREQGESICYGPDGRTLYLTSEKLPTPLIEVRPGAKEDSDGAASAAGGDTSSAKEATSAAGGAAPGR